MKNIVVLISLCFSFVNAVEYFGFTPTISQYNDMNAYSNSLQQYGVESIAVLGTNDTSGIDAVNFLAAMGIYNTTLDTLQGWPSITGVESTLLDKRAPIHYECRKSKVHFGDEGNFQICLGVAALATAGVNSITLAIKSKTCTVVENGQGTFCTGFFTFTAAASTVISAAEVNRYCPVLLKYLTTTCKDEGGVAQNVDGYKLSETVNQGAANCNNIVGACSATTLS